ncbi:MAG: cation:proton antiporter [Acidobacteriaceae bacterium]|nr:cation:proton antiporter [Acidobacteriaceae bacterium]
MLLFLTQTVVILLVTLTCGWIATKLGQVRVIGQIIGGIVVGPSLVGRFFPHVYAALFPNGSLAAFEVLSTLGLILFLFIVGTEIDLNELYGQRTLITLTSSISILLPFCIAVVVAYPLQARFAPRGIPSSTFILFVGISMSITAFPVLAKILEERGLLGSSLGTIAISCAAVDDVVAWLLLAVALTLERSSNSPASLLLRLLALIAYVAVMFRVVRPIASRWQRRRLYPVMSFEIWGCTLAGVFASAACTEAIGVHPLFGAFVAGLCLPRNRDWQNEVRRSLNTIVSIFLLPLFFVLTGIHTRIDLLANRAVVVWMMIVLLGAIAGKIGGAAIAARCFGQSWRNSVAIGTLLNTRGLVELVVLKIAYDASVFSPALFTIFVSMTLITTALTNPLLNVIFGKSEPSRDAAIAEVPHPRPMDVRLRS